MSPYALARPLFLAERRRARRRSIRRFALLLAPVVVGALGFFLLLS